jgi:predicted ABC-type ATPase
MQFNNPIPFSEAIDYQAVKELLPTVLSSKELMRLPVAIRERSFFAAKVMDARFLQKGANLCDDILNPHSVTRADGTSAIEGMSMSKARALLKEYQDSIGYTAPEGKAGTIEDLSSDARLNLIVKMNVGFAQGYGQWKQGQSPAVLDEFPCQELYRREDRIEPRDWPARWEEAGGEFYGDGGDYGPRMIARKDDPIWEDISAFGIPYPPFDFNSGMDVMDVSRDEAIELGVITEDEDSPDPDEDSDFNDDLETSVQDLEDFLQKPLAESVGPAFELTPDGILKFLMEENEDYEPGELEEESLAAKLAGGEEANEDANKSDYQCLMLEMPADVAEAMQEFSAQIPEETLTPEAANEASRFVGSNFSVPLAKYAVGWDESIKPALATARAKAVTGATDPAERDSIEKGHGAFIGSCGHTISMCQCGKCGGPTMPVAAPCRQCAEAAANEIEEFSHVTAIWGLDGVPAAEIEAALAELSPDPIQATLGKVTRFSGSRQGTDNADVLVIAVESPDLVALHDALVERFSDRLAPQTHNFNPHSTLAYVLPGTNMDLDGDTSFEGWPVTFSAAVLAGQGSRSRMQIGAEATANEADFDESKHPRDAGGKFATEPGSSSPSPALAPSSGYVSTQVLDDLPEKELRELDTIEQQYPPTDQGGIDTCHRQSDGNEEHPHYTAERLLLHNKIVSEIRANAPAQATPEFLLMGGGTAAGKSTVIQAGKIMLPDRPVMIDSDAIKAKLPEYQTMVNNGDTRAAGYCHSESSDIAKRTMNESFVGKQNVVLDGTGNSSSAGVEQKCALARAAGFKVRAEYVTCSVDEAIRRATDRAKETGRMVGETQIRNLHRHVSQIFPEAVKKGLFDEAHLWDTEGNSPVLVASVKGTELTVHDDKAWARFLLKGH